MGQAKQRKQAGLPARTAAKTQDEFADAAISRLNELKEVARHCGTGAAIAGLTATLGLTLSEIQHDETNGQDFYQQSQEITEAIRKALQSEWDLPADRDLLVHALVYLAANLLECTCAECEQDSERVAPVSKWVQ